MNVNRKLDRLKHWAGERMGNGEKTTTSDEFKSLEVEMNLRGEGMERMQKSMNTYIQSISKRTDTDSKEKTLPVTHMGTIMVAHGNDFEPDSEFGQCLTNLGRAHERLGAIQESYIDAATSTWLSSLEKSIAQMKEYQAARKKLESRRLAFDTSQAKLAKSKKDDFRMEEDLRSQKAKYEESSEIVYRRMLDIKEAEVDSVNDITALLDAELNYHDRAREVLLQLKKSWPVTSDDTASAYRQGSRARAHTIDSNRGDDLDENARSNRIPVVSRVMSAQQTSTGLNSPRRDFQMETPSTIPPMQRYATSEAPQSLRDNGTASMAKLSRVPTDSTTLSVGRSNLRPVNPGGNGVFDDDQEEAYNDGLYRQASPGLSRSYVSPRSASVNYPPSTQGFDVGKKAPPPPPPPSRAKKPPPPPPLFRNAMSTSAVPQHYQ